MSKKLFTWAVIAGGSAFVLGGAVTAIYSTQVPAKNENATNQTQNNQVLDVSSMPSLNKSVPSIQKTTVTSVLKKPSVGTVPQVKQHPSVSDDTEVDYEGGDDGGYSNQNQIVPQPVQTANPSATFTMSQVSSHNSSASCYSVISGSVYDLTNWINQHPGGPGAILSLCGVDGTSAFDGQHGGQARPASELAGFKIGTLVK